MRKENLLLVFLALLMMCTLLAAQDTDIEWELKYSETFDSPIEEPEAWTEDTYGDSSQWNVDIFDDDGAFFADQYGEIFTTTLDSFRAFRKSFTYGQDGWLTFELYGRDEDKDGQPESGGKFINFEGKAKLVSTRHTDGGIIRPTEALPEIYRLQLTVSNVDFGGDQDDDGDWTENGRFNGYDGDEYGSPWSRSGGTDGSWTQAWGENGLYFLCITDYENPAPHNNVFWHHHRKLVIDSDNNNHDGSSWSYVYNPNTGEFENDGSMYINLMWLNGESFGSDFSGNHFINWTPVGWQTAQWNANFADKYLANESYVITVERTPNYYTLSISGNFYWGGNTTYTATKAITEYPVVWHYNRMGDDYDGSKDEIKVFADQLYHTWPKDSSYPDYFFCGDPHINFYEGTAEFDDIKLWVGTEENTGVERDHKAMTYHLKSYPNPFTNSTTIQFALEQQSSVALKVYNTLGQLVYEQPFQYYAAGNHDFMWRGQYDLTPGVYFAVLYIRNGQALRTETLKMINLN